MATKAAVSRLSKELKLLRKEPVENIEAVPLDSNILEWHYVIRGPKDSPYCNGLYHGKLVFPSNYPFKPPSIYMLTPNGRFQTNTRLCLSMSDFHPETWNPLWSVSSILSGLLSFMLEKESTYGSISTSESEKRRLSTMTMSHNMRDKNFVDLFPHHVQAYEAENESKQKDGKHSSLRFRGTNNNNNGVDDNNNNNGINNNLVQLQKYFVHALVITFIIFVLFYKFYIL